MTDPKVPGYLKFADELRAEILSGQLAEGERLPALTQLAAQYGVPKGVAERAVAQLRSEGLVVARQGSGTFVRRYAKIPRISPGRLARAHWAAGHAIQDHDTAPRPRTVDVMIGEEPAPDWAAEMLGVKPGALVVFRSRRFLVDERLVQLSTSYLPVELARGTAIMHTDSGPGGIYARLEEKGFGPTRFSETLVARAPRPDEVERLDLPRRSAIVFEITRTAWAGDRPVEVNRMVLDAEVYALTYNFPA